VTERVSHVMLAAGTEETIDSAADRQLAGVELTLRCSRRTSAVDPKRKSRRRKRRVCRRSREYQRGSRSLIETTITIKPSLPAVIRGHRSATSCEFVRAGMIAAAARVRIYAANAAARLQRNRRRVRNHRGRATASNTLYRAKGGAGARREATKDCEGLAIRSK
jgi:hypothetical protein